MDFKLVFVTLFSLFFHTFIEAMPQVVGWSQPILASLGDNVVLPCHVEPPVNVLLRTVEWSKHDTKDKQEEYVHLHRRGRENLDMKKSSYVGRTALFQDELRRGNISLRIFNLTLEDEGSYTCFIPKLESRTRSSMIHLIVVSHSFQTTEKPVHPTSSPTLDLNGETNMKGVVPRSRMIPVVVFFAVILIIAGVAGPLVYKFLKHKLMTIDHCGLASLMT